MNIIIDKDGNLYVNDIQDIGERLAACIENPADGATVVFSKEKGMWVVGEFPTPAPALFIVTESAEGLDKTWQEIKDALDAGRIVNIADVGTDATTVTQIVGAKKEDGDYNIYVSSSSDPAYVASAADGYPAEPEDVN